MVSFEQMVRGIMRYLDNEILNKMGWQRWLVGTGISLYSKNAREIFEEYKDNDFIRMLGVIDGDMIDIDKLHQCLMEQARKGSVSFELPMNLGSITLNEHDVNNMHSYIMNS